MLKNTTKISYSPLAIKRIVSELASFHKAPPHGIFINSDEEDIGYLTVLIIGPEDTPYEDGFFFFEMVFPEDYPFSPPKVEIRTTNPEYRFNPNFYLEGKVCLSILGTWQGPSWIPTMTIDTTLISIQARMNELPLENEPGFENGAKKAKLEYNNIVRELTLRYSVLDQLKNSFPRTKLNPSMSFESFRPVMIEHFLKKYDNYFKLVDTIPNTVLNSRFGGYSRLPDLVKLKKDLADLKDILSPPLIASNILDNSSSSTSTSTWPVPVENQDKNELTTEKKVPRLPIIVPKGRPVKTTS